MRAGRVKREDEVGGSCKEEWILKIRYKKIGKDRKRREEKEEKRRRFVALLVE